MTTFASWISAYNDKMEPLKQGTANVTPTQHFTDDSKANHFDAQAHWHFAFKIISRSRCTFLECYCGGLASFDSNATRRLSTMLLRRTAHALQKLPAIVSDVRATLLQARYPARNEWNWKACPRYWRHPLQRSMLLLVGRRDILSIYGFVKFAKQYLSQ